jgi:hypothetical protein
MVRLSSDYLPRPKSSAQDCDKAFQEGWSSG